MFLYQKDEIMHELMKLIIFDALVGNNDRHFFNWGVIRSVEGSFQPYFSPVYDTARGLFWNYSESKLADIVEVNSNINRHIQKYCKKSRPKIGWEKEKNLDHFELFEKIYKDEYYILKQEVRKNFQSLMSMNRTMMICKCLEYRFDKLQDILYDKV